MVKLQEEGQSSLILCVHSIRAILSPSPFPSPLGQNPFFIFGPALFVIAAVKDKLKSHITYIIFPNRQNKKALITGNPQAMLLPTLYVLNKNEHDGKLILKKEASVPSLFGFSEIVYQNGGASFPFVSFMDES